MLKTLKLIITLIIVMNGYICKSDTMTKNFSANGTYEGSFINLITKQGIINGTIIGKEKLYLQSPQILGTGVIEGKNIEIVTDELLFTGTINCSHSCIITTKKALNTLPFKKQGNGTFEFIVDEAINTKLNKTITYPTFKEIYSELTDQQRNTLSIYRLFIQIQEPHEETSEWLAIESVIKDIKYFLSKGYQVSTNALNEFSALLSQIPWTALRTDQLSSISCSIDEKIISFANLNENENMSIFSNRSGTNLLFFVIFDHTHPDMRIQQFQNLDDTIKQIFTLSKNAIQNNLTKNKKFMLAASCEHNFSISRLLFN